MFFQKFKELVEEERNKNGGKGNFSKKYFLCFILEVQSEAVRCMFESCRITYCMHNLIKDV